SEEFTPGQPRPVGAVRGILPHLCAFPVELRGRNNALAALAVEQIRIPVQAAVERYGADRVAIVVGTSTSGVGESKRAIQSMVEKGSLPDGYHFAQQELGSL